MRRFRSARRRTHRTDGCSSIWTSGYRRAATERIVPYCSLSTLLFSPYIGSSLALQLTSSSDRTPAHRSRTTLRFVYVGLRPRSGSARTTLAPPSERPNGRWISAFLTVRRLLYSNGFLPPFSSAEFCSAYQTLTHSCRRKRRPSDKASSFHYNPFSNFRYSSSPSTAN